MGSVRSVTTKASTKSRMSGFEKVLKDTRTAFQESLRDLRDGRKEGKMNWADEVESSQKTQDGVVDPDTSGGNSYIPAAFIPDDDDDKSSVAESMNSDKSTRDDEVPPSPPSLAIATSATCGNSTPPNLVAELPDLDKTPRTPHIAAISEAELYKLKAQEEFAARVADPFQVGAPMTESQFNAQMSTGKAKAGG